MGRVHRYCETSYSAQDSSPQRIMRALTVKNDETQPWLNTSEAENIPPDMMRCKVETASLHPDGGKPDNKQILKKPPDDKKCCDKNKTGWRGEKDGVRLLRIGWQGSLRGGGIWTGTWIARSVWLLKVRARSRAGKGIVPEKGKGRDTLDVTEEQKEWQ